MVTNSDSPATARLKAPISPPFIPESMLMLALIHDIPPASVYTASPWLSVISTDCMTVPRMVCCILCPS